MVRTMYSTVVRTLRLRNAVAFVLLLVAVYWTGIRPWMTDWGSTAAEQRMTLPGDALIPGGTRRSTLAITIAAPPDVIWPWLVQIGQDRAGYYSYTWLENLVGADIHNADAIHPEWQQLVVGDAWRLVAPDYLWGLGQEAFSPVLIMEPGRALVVEMFGAHVLEPIDERTTRLLVRGPTGPANLMSTMVMDPVVFTMYRRMLFGLKARAEGRPEAPAPLMAIAQLGWGAAGLAVAGLFLSRRRRRYWLVIPVVAASPALWMSGDVQAGLAAFLAVGITALGFLIFGRSWSGPTLVIGSLVMLTLLLAPDAYIAIGLAFALLLLATSAAMFAGRSASATP